MSNFFRSPLVWVLGILLACGGGAAYWTIDSRQQRERFAQELAESERLEQQRTTANEAKRKREQQKLQDDIQAKRDADEQQRQLDIERSQAELKRQRFVADERSLPQDERVRREREIKAQNDAANDAVRAQNEVKRQKNFVIQRENERAAERYQRELEAAARAKQEPHN